MLRDSKQPKGRSANALAHQLLTFLTPISESLKAVDVFCGEADTQCRNCAEEHLNYETNWLKYVKFYMLKLKSIYSRAFGCIRDLVKTCRIQVDKQLNRSLLTGGQLWAQFDQSWDDRARPSRQEMAHWIAQITQLNTIADSVVPLDLCAPNSTCQSCLEKTVNCWYSKERLHPANRCTTPNEWRAINYTPSVVSQFCSVGHVHPSLEDQVFTY